MRLYFNDDVGKFETTFDPKSLEGYKEHTYHIFGFIMSIISLFLIFILLIMLW